MSFDAVSYAMGVRRGGSITVEPLSVTENGTYAAPEKTAYAPVVVAVSPRCAHEDVDTLFDYGRMLADGLSWSGTVWDGT